MAHPTEGETISPTVTIPVITENPGGGGSGNGRPNSHSPAAVSALSGGSTSLSGVTAAHRPASQSPLHRGGGGGRRSSLKRDSSTREADPSGRIFRSV